MNVTEFLKDIAVIESNTSAELKYSAEGSAVKTGNKAVTINADTLAVFQKYNVTLPAHGVVAYVEMAGTEGDES